MKILLKYSDIKAEILNIIDNIKYYENLLKQEDLSELDYYKKMQYTGIKFFSITFSTVEKEVIKKEQSHKLNRQIVKELLEKEKTKLLEKQNQISNIENALTSLEEQDEYIIRCRYFHKMRYKDIEVNYSARFRYTLTQQTLKKRVKKATQKMKKLINQVYFVDLIDLESTL